MIYLNQKMNLTKEELENLINDIKDLNVVLFPTMPLLCLASDKFDKIGSQDVSEFENGSYTGQTSIHTLKSLGVKYCLIGHSEKRTYLHETPEQIIKKIELCINNNITPIYIIGETKEEYQKGNSKIVIEKEITEVFNNLHCPLNNIIICYEPNWSIGACAAEIPYIEEMTKTIKSVTNDYYEINPPIIYGGGINEENIQNINNIEEIKGFLIGNASLNSKRIRQLYELTK